MSQFKVDKEVFTSSVINAWFTQFQFTDDDKLLCLYYNNFTILIYHIWNYRYVNFELYFHNDWNLQLGVTKLLMLQNVVILNPDYSQILLWSITTR